MPPLQHAGALQMARRAISAAPGLERINGSRVSRAVLFSLLLLVVYHHKTVHDRAATNVSTSDCSLLHMRRAFERKRLLF
jgi:hypothetical protein